MKALGAQSFILMVLVQLFISGCSSIENKTGINRLEFASSPYLQEHADNPVDWYEWGDEALKIAKAENKPILISIGYASCHWCHEMERESFMDTAIARVMNENFICIKVDREERPDIDNIYMNALRLLSGDTGWPLNAFALPDGKPFFAGTYYTKKGWMSLLVNVAKSYKDKHALVVTQANALLNGIAEEELSLVDTTASHYQFPQAAYQNLYDSIFNQADLTDGGLKGLQKFPTPAFPEFLLQHYYITGSNSALQAANLTLRKMAMGGIYDHLSGGFARYTIDPFWKVPHFEKMLYDNAQLVSVYAHAYQVTKNPFYKDILTETLSFIENKLSASEGGYYSSLNADTEDEEGKFYTWTRNEFLSVVDGDEKLATYFQVSQEGNWKPGINILRTSLTPEEFAVESKINPADFIAGLKKAKSNLLKKRDKRNYPSIDTKIITAWNCILLKGYADAYAATATEDYLVKAKALALFIEKKLLSNTGELKRSLNDGKNRIDGFLDDYAWAASAFQRLYEVSFDSRYITISKLVVDYAIAHFWNDTTGLFFYVRNQSNLVLRKTEIADNEIPSSNAVFAKVLYNIGTLYNDTLYTAKSWQMFYSVKNRIKQTPRYYIQWCNFAAFLSAKSYEVVVTGRDAKK